MVANNSRSTQRSIPIEVLELFIDAFVLDHGLTRDATFYQTLVSCALSSRTLLPRSRHHLYSHIRLSTLSTNSQNYLTRKGDAAQQSSKIELLWRALTLNPSLAGCIRTLELAVNSPSVVSPALLLILEKLESYLRARASSQSDSESSPESPCQIPGPGLQELALMGDSTAVVRPLPEGFLERISQLLSVHPHQLEADSSSINSNKAAGTIGISCLRLSRLSAVPATLLSTAKAPLRRVFLQKVSFAGAEGHASRDTDPENGALSKVEELTSHDCGAGLDKALRCRALDTAILADGGMRMRFSRLTRLQMCATHRQDVEWGAAVIKASAETLQTLEVGGLSQGQAQYATMLCSRINLCSLPLLTSLVVTTLAASTPSSPVSPLELLETFDFAREESASLSLTSIELNVRCMFHKYTLSSLNVILKPEYSAASMNGHGAANSVQGHSNTQKREPDRWTPTLAKPSVRAKFQRLSHINVNVMLGLGLPCMEPKGQDGEGRVSAQLNGYLTDGLASLKETGVEARFRAEATLLNTA